MRPLKSRRAFLIVLGLLILTLLFIVGMGLMWSQEARYRGAARALEMNQAYELARGGLEDARIKLEIDQTFPPKPADDQKLFTYSEDMTVNGQPWGSYFVTIDISKEASPFGIVDVTSVGTMGPKDQPVAQRTLHYELHRAPGLPFQWVRMQDDGSL